MSSSSGLRHTDGQRVPLGLAPICAASTPALELGARYPTGIVRAAITRTFMAFATGVATDAVNVRRTELNVGGRRLSAQLYEPVAAASNGSLLVFFHGGGWVVGSVESHGGLCRLVARQAGCRVLSVDYRLAPEHRFPAAYEDALASFRWAVAHADELGTDASRIAVGGDSAGGNLAATVARGLDGHEVQPCLVWMLYPVCDADIDRYASTATFRKGPLLSAKAMRSFVAQYAPRPEDQLDPRLSIVRAGSLAGMAPSYVATAGMDILRDQGHALATRMREDGVQVEERRFPGMPHGFASILLEPHARAAAEEAIAALAAGFA